MIILLIDTVVLWFLLNLFSEEDWDDQKLKIFGIVFSISLLGGLAANYSVQYVGPFGALGAYFLIALLCLWTLAGLPIKKALSATGIFLAYKFVMVLALVFLFA